jgi:hypothetical protein
MIKTMQKRIEEIKQADRKAYYELANEIGISEYSLYSFMTRDECSTNTEEKISKFLKDYKTKDEQIEQWKHEYEVLDACLELAQGKIAELKVENERLRDIIKSISQPVLLPDVPIEVINKYKQTLQEIKSIAERAFAVCDDDCGNANKFKEIIELTKAEEE